MAKLKRGVCFLLVLVFVVSLLPVSALADDLNGTQSMDSAQLIELVKAYAAEMDDSQDAQVTTMEQDSASLKDLVSKIEDKLTGNDVLDTLNSEAPLADETPAENGGETVTASGSTVDTIGKLLSGLGEKVNDDNVNDLKTLFGSISDIGSADDATINNLFDKMAQGTIGIKDAIGGIAGSGEPTTLDKLLEALEIAGDPSSGDTFKSFADALKAATEKNGDAFVASMEKVFGGDASQKLIDLIGLENNDILTAITDAFKGGIPDSTEGVADAVSEALRGLGLSGAEGIGSSITGIIANIKGAFGGSEADTAQVMSAAETTLVANGMSVTDAKTATSSSSFLTMVGGLLKNFPVATVAAIVTGALAKAGVDEFDELDEVWDEILDEFSMDDADLDFIKDLIGSGANVSIEDLIALIKGSGSGSADIDWDSIFADLKLNGDLLAKFKAWIEANGGNVDIDWILKWFENNTDLDLDLILKLIIGKIGGGDSSFDIEAIIKLITGGTGTKIEIERILELFKSLSGKCDISVIIKILSGLGGKIDISGLEAILKLLVELGGKIDLSWIIEIIVSMGGSFDFSGLQDFLKLLISLSGSFDLSAIIDILKQFKLSFPDFTAILKFLLELGGNIDLGGFDFKSFIEFLINLKNSMNLPSISAVIDWLLSLKGSLGLDWSALLKLIFSKLTELGGNFIKLIQWLLSLLTPKDPSKPVTDPIKDPQTPLKPYDPNNSIITDPKTPLSPITGDSTDYVSLAIMAVLALFSMLGMVALAKPATAAAGETQEVMGDDSFETERKSFVRARRERDTRQRPKM